MANANVSDDGPVGNSSSKKRGRTSPIPSSSSSSSLSNKKQSTDAFMASMTFAAPRKPGELCDCCDEGECSLLSSEIPWSVRQATMEYWKTHTMPRTQERELIRRQDNVTVYRLTMPQNAEPLVEYGNTHRIIYVNLLTQDSSLCSIGKGVVGSSDETNGRSKLSWEEGCAYLVPSNGGRSVGWVHTAANQLDDDDGDGSENKNDNNNTDIGPTPAVVYTIKIPKKDETNHNDQSNKDGGWTHQLTQLCQDTLLHQKKDEDCVYIAMSEEASKTVRQVLMELNKPS